MQRQNELNFFTELAVALNDVQRRNLATQLDLYRKTGVQQATISRAKNNKLKKISPKLVILKNHTNMILEQARVPGKVGNATDRFLAAGGTEDELATYLEFAILAISREKRQFKH